jgi:SET domain-containing protein
MYRADVENQTLNYFAARDIVDGEELSVNYNSGGQPEYEKNTWFDNKGIDLIVD